MSQLEPGTRIDERYRIVAPLGAGGMGIVYRALDEKLGRQVAVKTVAADRVGDAKARARLVREARSAAALEHPGIAQVYDVGEMEDGGAYLVMELVRGHSLRTLMSTGEIARPQILKVISEVAAALDHAHGQGVIHRDIKPDNVMVRDDGRAVLLDFGLAKELGPAAAHTVRPDTPTEEVEHLTKEGAVIGTLSYLAPEQARGRDVGPKSDLFALATTAYEALTGRLPWDGRNAAAVLAQILVDDAPPPSSLESSLPVAVDRVFARALAKEPGERYDNASDLARALTDAVDARASVSDVQVASPRPSDDAPVGGGPSSDGARGLALAGLLAGLLVAGGLVASLLWPHDTPVNPDPAPAGLGPDAVIGCPIFEASGVEEPSAWLGAMGADLACSRLTLRLGGDAARTRVPAELLELPAVANDDFPVDPFVAPGAREATLRAAGELDAILDGSVTRDEDGWMSVELTLRRREGPPLARGTGRSEALYVAVHTALDALLAEGALEARERLDPEVAPWLGTESARVAALFADLGDASLTGVGMESTCHELIVLGDALGPLRGEVGRTCRRWGIAEARDIEPPALDRSSAASLALTAPEHAEELPESETRAIADELATARRNERHPLARATIAKGEIQLWEQLGEMDRARDLLLTAAADMPRDWFLRVHLVRALLRTPGAYAATRALAAWHPGSPEAWRTLALPFRRDTERALPFMRRAYESGGALPLYGMYLADGLLVLGRREEVRAIAARYATGGPRTRLAGEYLRARVEISEVRFGRAFDRLEAALIELPIFGELIDGDDLALTWLLDLSEVLGREREAADPLVDRFVLSEPHRLLVDQPHYELPVIDLCMHASPDRARACFASLRQLRDGRAARAGQILGADALLSGAERWVEGDAAGAVEAWRPLVQSASAFVPVEAFEREGEVAAVERLERSHLRHIGFAGAHPVHVREARRAARAGDTARARELAQRVVQSWGTADVSVPAVAEMRALLARLPSE